jgi:hypothetical protein
MATKKRTPKPKPFPNYIFIKRENEGTEDEYFDVHTESAAHALDSTDTLRVAVYRLEEVKEGALEPIFYDTN